MIKRTAKQLQKTNIFKETTIFLTFYFSYVKSLSKSILRGLDQFKVNICQF